MQTDVYQRDDCLHPSKDLYGILRQKLANNFGKAIRGVLNQLMNLKTLKQ
jgi:hypothetical protein